MRRSISFLVILASVMSKLPKSLLAQIGRVATISAFIEQEIILHASAMASHETEGHPVEHLRTDFDRLRVRWYALCKKYLNDMDINKFIHPLNSELASAWPVRGFIIHGRWYPEARGKFRVEWWAQTDTLRRYKKFITLAQLSHFADGLEKMLASIYRYHETGELPPSRKKQRSPQRPTNPNFRTKPAKP